MVDARALYPTDVAAPKGLPARRAGVVIRNQTGWVQGSRHQERRKGAASLQVRPMMELGNVAATKRIVGAGLGWSIVPSTAIRGDTDTTILVRRLKPSLKRQLGMVLRQDKVRDPAMRATIAAFEQLVR